MKHRRERRPIRIVCGALLTWLALACDPTQDTPPPPKADTTPSDLRPQAAPPTVTPRQVAAQAAPSSNDTEMMAAGLFWMRFVDAVGRDERQTAADMLCSAVRAVVARQGPARFWPALAYRLRFAPTASVVSTPTGLALDVRFADGPERIFLAKENEKWCLAP